MVYGLLCLCGIVILLLCWKLFRMKQAAKEISREFAEKLQTDTNTLITVSTTDKDMCVLADGINRQLQVLRKEFLQYHQGNAELKTAITNISHDLRTPLTAICGYLELLKQTEDPEKIARYTAIMTERTEMMQHLTHELFRYLLTVSDEEAADFPVEEVFVNQILTESISSFYPALTARGITPQICITPQRILRQGNRAALARVFSNLLNNAVKYSDGDLEISLSDSGCILFSNSAKELSKVKVGKLFDRFFTVENASNATGLGLSIARSLIARMGGTLTADYEGGRLILMIQL